MSRWGSGNSLRVFGALPLEPRWFGRPDLALCSPSSRTLSPAGGRARVPPERAGRGPSPAVPSAPASVRPNCGYLLHHQPPQSQLRCRSRSAGRGSSLPGCWGLERPGRPGMGGARGKGAQLGRAPSPASSGGSPISAALEPGEAAPGPPTPGHERRRHLGSAPWGGRLPARLSPPLTASRGPSSAPRVV